MSSSSEAAAQVELKRKHQGIGDTEFPIGKVAKEDAQPQAMEASRKVETEFNVSLDLSKVWEQEMAFRRMVLSKELRRFASQVCSRAFRGKPSEGSLANAGLSSKDGDLKVEAFLNAVGCQERCGLGDFAASADPITDDALERMAKLLKGAGAVDMLKSALPLPCLLVEHFPLVKKHLFA